MQREPQHDAEEDRNDREHAEQRKVARPKEDQP
jgi:hypothetical protein